MAIEKAAVYHNIPIEQEFDYAQAIKTGDTIYLSGQVSVNPDDQDQVVGTGNMEAQIRQVYANIQKVLGQYDLSVDHIVDETIFVTDIDAFGAVAGSCRRDIFAGSAIVASTVIQIQRLWLAELMIEIKCVAKVGR
ncbi:MAG: RidA family protein [Cyanobacteria bacterium J06559_3]